MYSPLNLPEFPDNYFVTRKPRIREVRDDEMGEVHYVDEYGFEVDPEEVEE